MSVEQQLRAYGRTIEQRRVPITADEAVNTETVIFDHTRDVKPRPPRHRWMLSAAAVIALVAATVGLLTSGGRDSEPSDIRIDSPPTNPTIPPTTVPVTTPATAPVPTTAAATAPPTDAPTTPTTEPALSDLVGADAAAIGETVTFADGAVARVNAVVLDAPPRNTLFLSEDDLDTLTEFEIERCLGDDVATDAATLMKSRAMVSGQWIAVFDDGTSVPGRPGYHPFVAFDPGGCVRAYVAVPTPDDTNVAGVILLPTRRYGAWQEQFWQLDALTPDSLQGAAGWNFTRSQLIDGPLRPSVPPDTVAIGEPMATGFSYFDATVLEIIDNAEPRPNSFDILGELRPELPPQPEPGRKLVEVRAEYCTPADRPDLPPGQSYAGVDELLWLIATDDNYIGTAGPERLNGTAGARVWDVQGRDTFLDPPIFHTSNLLSDGSDESDLPEGTPVPSPAPGECISGYVQIDLPADATAMDVIVASEAGGEEYSEVGRTRINDPS
jgi:hypothetical protein